MFVTGALVDVEPGTDENVCESVRLPCGEESTREVVVRQGTVRFAVQEGERRGRADLQDSVQLREGPGEARAFDVQVTGPGPRRGDRSPPERQRFEIGLHAPGEGRDVSRQRKHGERGIEGHHRCTERTQVQAGATPGIEAHRAWSHGRTERFGPIEEARRALIAPLLGALLVHVYGGPVHRPRIIADVQGEIRQVDDVPQAFAALVTELLPSSIALSGGDTARRCYELLATADVEWSDTEVYFGDERWLPIHDPESNEGMARVTFLDQVEPRAIHSMYDADATITEAADAYDRLLAERDPIDLLHLGLGRDGHIASLFAGTEALDEARRLVVATGDDLHPHPRLTITLPAITRARLVVFTVAGADKRDAFERVGRGDDLPATRVRGDQIVWLVDAAAAGTA
jgi:6-phosphogluconolactonase